MKIFEKVKGSNCSHFSNPMHLGFHQRIYTRLQLVAFPEKLHVTTEFDEYEACIEDEKERTRETRATGMTLDLAESNKVRTQMLPFVGKTIVAARWSPLEAVKAAGRALEPIYETYKDISRKPDDAKSALIDSFLLDIKKDNNAAHVSTLHLDETLTQLKDANNAYKQLRENRLKENLSRKLEPSKVLRQRTDALYTRICELIYASMLFATEDDDVTMLTTLTLDLNGIIDEFNNSWNISKGVREANKNNASKAKAAGKSKSKSTQKEESNS